MNYADRDSRTGDPRGRALATLPYREVWAVDFEYRALPGDRPEPVCMVACELRSGRWIRLWEDELLSLRLAPFDTGPETLFVAYFASAELGCFETLGWQHPRRIIDLFCEFRAETNGTVPAYGNSLLGALLYHDLRAMGAEEKTTMRDLILAGGPWSAEQRADILAYCQEDVDALARLLLVMLRQIMMLRGASAARCCAAATWGLLRGWNRPASQSMSRC
jgi:hypothetical protein